jgi:signal transduction histidine kinase/putative methionine-R-sulfoxide reductase with GAF domain
MIESGKGYESMSAPRLFEALAQLNQIGSAINQLDTGDLASIQTVLQSVVTSANRVVRRATAILYTYDEGRKAFVRESRVSAGEQSDPAPEDGPRPDGLGARAVARRERILSYLEDGVQINPARAALGDRALACFPLIVGGEALGVLYIYIQDETPFEEVDLLILGNFANLAATALSLVRQHALAQQEQNRRDRELRRLRRSGMQISSRSSLKGTLDAILQVALEITDAVYGIFRLVDRSGSNLITQAISGVNLGQPAVEALHIDERSVMGTVALRREPVMVADLREEPWRSIYYPFDRELEMRSELAVPLIGASGRLEGVLNLESPQVNGFDRQDRYILQILATQAVVATQEARLLDPLQEISDLLPRLPAQKIHQTLVQRACDLLNVPAGMIWLLEKDHLILQAASNPDLAGLRISAGAGLAGQAVQESQPVTLLVASDDQMCDYPDLPGFQCKGAALVVPLYASSDSRPLGAFSIFTGPADLRDFSQTDWDRKVLDILGHYATLAVQVEAQQEALRVAQDQRALTEAFAAIGDIAANLLHRLNNKIGTIPVRVEGIQDKCQPALAADPYLEKNLDEIQRSAAEAMNVVRESLFHLHPIQLAPVSAAGSVREALAATRLPQGIEVEIQNLDHLPPVQAGPKRLALVFSNLLENAADAMAGAGKILVTGSAQDGWVRITVRDSGPGIPPDLQEKIFEFNYSSRAAAQPGKLGFGLWWVKSLTARFGGSVQVESDGVNGTAFIISLPQAKDESWALR